MTFRPHLLLQIGGPLFETDEWSCNFRLTGSIYQAESPSSRVLTAQSLLEHYTDATIAYLQDSDSHFSVAAKLAYVKVNPIGEDGRYESDESTIATFLEGTLPSGTTQAGPAQLALVVSHLTSASRGRGSRGRHYIPVGSIDPTSTGVIPQTVCERQAAASARYFSLLNEPPGPELLTPPVVNVMSELGSPGPARQVERVSVGNVLDTQRRRRESLIETYYGADVENLN